MTITINSPKKLNLTYEVPDHLKDIVDIEELRKKDLENLEEELKKSDTSIKQKIDEGLIWRMKFPNMILDAINIEEKEKEVTITAIPIHPHRSDLGYKNDPAVKIKPKTITVHAPLIDKDNNLILAIRGGSFFSGKIGIIPSGHLEYLKTPEKQVEEEFEEEVGYNFDKNIEEIPITKIFTNRETGGIVIHYILKTNKTFEEIKKYWENSQDKDEHKTLLKLTKKEAEKLVDKGHILIDNKKVHTVKSTHDSIKYYLEKIN